MGHKLYGSSGIVLAINRFKILLQPKKLNIDQSQYLRIGNSQSHLGHMPGEIEQVEPGNQLHIRFAYQRFILRMLFEVSGTLEIWEINVVSKV